MEIVRKLQTAGYETWCVGGAVRDALLGIRNQDWDIATAAEPNIVRRMFSPVVPLGIEFGTVGVVDRFGVMHEVTTFRRDVQHDGRHAVVEFGASFVEDLNRRDFTINAIAFDPINQKLFDPFHGRDDLAANLVRAVGVPIDRFVEDRLRVLRGIRFASRFGFGIEPITWQAMVDSGPHLGRLSYERVKQELDKTLEQATSPSGAFRRWKECGAFRTLLPAFEHVSEAALRAVDVLPRPTGAMTAGRRVFRRQLRLAALFSDRSARETVSAMKTLRASKAETSFVGALIERWQALEPDMTRALAGANVVTDAQLRLWAAAIGRMRVREFMRVAWARWAGARAVGEGAVAPGFAPSLGDQLSPGFVPSATAVHSAYRRLLRIAWNDAIEIADLAIDGDDLRAAGIPFGPHVGQILAELLKKVVDDPGANTRDALLAAASLIYKRLTDRPPGLPGTNLAE
ncbi:MAG: hypothetical protein H7Z40_04830 [Phycisphaerae bacterium]|nr:hypothetical protein [Gemmatimonadaceae bacterium]